MILNLTQHPSTPEQIDAGVIDMQGVELKKLKALLTFDSMPDKADIEQRAWLLVKLANRNYAAKYGKVMIGGAPFLMPSLVSALKSVYLNPLCAFSKRESVEKTLDDGSVVKTNVFKHVGFVEL